MSLTLEQFCQKGASRPGPENEDPHDVAKTLSHSQRRTQRTIRVMLHLRLARVKGRLGLNSDPRRLRERHPMAPETMLPRPCFEDRGAEGSGGNARASRTWKGAIRRKSVRFRRAPDSKHLDRAVLFLGIEKSQLNRSPQTGSAQ
jgi:hypothetical protein